MLKKFRMMLAGAIAAVVVISGSNVGWMQQTEVQAATDLSQVPGYTGSPYTVVNDNEPDFAKSDFTTDAFEDYSDCLLYTSPSPRDRSVSRMPSSA